MVKICVMCASVLMAVGCTTVDYADGQSQQNPLDGEESALISELNDLRAGKGAGPLKVCASLNVSASLHSDDMREVGYLDDEGPDGSTPFTRGCDAKFAPACKTPGQPQAGMAELVAKGHAEGNLTLEQWTKDTGSRAFLEDAKFVVVGIGRAMSSSESAIWTLDIASLDDPSCEAAP